MQTKERKRHYRIRKSSYRQCSSTRNDYALIPVHTQITTSSFLTTLLFWYWARCRNFLIPALPITGLSLIVLWYEATATACMRISTVITHAHVFISYKSGSFMKKNPFPNFSGREGKRCSCEKKQLSLHSLQETNACAYRAPGILQLHLRRRNKGRGSKRENMENVKG